MMKQNKHGVWLGSEEIFIVGKNWQLRAVIKVGQLPNKKWASSYSLQSPRYGQSSPISDSNKTFNTREEAEDNMFPFVKKWLDRVILDFPKYKSFIEKSLDDREKLLADRLQYSLF